MSSYRSSVFRQRLQVSSEPQSQCSEGHEGVQDSVQLTAGNVLRRKYFLPANLVTWPKVWQSHSRRYPAQFISKPTNPFNQALTDGGPANVG